MTMPDAINSIIKLMDSSEEKIKSRIYNVTSFSVTVLKLENKILIKYEDLENNVEDTFSKIIKFTNKIQKNF